MTFTSLVTSSPCRAFLVSTIDYFENDELVVDKILNFAEYLGILRHNNPEQYRMIFNKPSLDHLINEIEKKLGTDFYDEKLFVDFFEKINKTKPIYIYCRSGNRSKKSSEILKKIGFVKVYDLLGGYKNWIKNSN